MTENGATGLHGRHALITGGAGGIGAAIARVLSAQGAAVTLLGRRESVLAAMAAELQRELDKTDEDGNGMIRVAHVCADVGRRDTVEHAFAQAAQRFGRVDILINNAGQAASAPFSAIDDAHWQQMLNVNLSGTFYCTQTALPAMLEAGWGRIVNIASSAGLRGYAYVAAYCAAKHGVVGLTQALAREVLGKGVTVNAVCPGYTETDMLRRTVAAIVAKTGRSEQQALAALAADNPRQRLVQPDEVAHAVALLCLPGSDAANGQSITVPGDGLMGC